MARLTDPTVRLGCSGIQANSIFQDDTRHRKGCGVRKRKSCMGYAEPGCKLRGTAMEADAGTPARLANHLDFQPVNAPAYPRTKRLGGGLFGGKSSCEAFGRVALAHAIGLLSGGENAIEKALSVAFVRLLNAFNLNQVNTAANDHSEYQTNIRGLQGIACRACGFWPQTSESFSKAVFEYFDLSADKHGMRQASIIRDPLQSVGIPWALEMKAISREEPGRLVKSLTRAILACGGWVLSRSANGTGLIEILFEFERSACLEIYSILIATGLELSQGAHVRFTELCQCTRLLRKDCGTEIVSVDLEIRTFPREANLTPSTPHQ